MTLRYIDSQQPWAGERINGIRHARSIATSWTDAQLAAIGLERTPAPPPDNSPPPKRTNGTFREFMDLFTPGEQTAIAQAAMQNVPIKLWYDRAMGGDVPLDNDDTIAGVGALLATGLISQAAHDAVLDADYNDGKTSRVDPT